MSAVIFTACGGAQAPAVASAQAQSEVSVQASGSAQPTAPLGKLRRLRTFYSGFEYVGKYSFRAGERVVKDGVGYRTVLDMEMGRQMIHCFTQGCTHTTPECTAAGYSEGLGALRFWAADENALYWVSGGETSSAVFYKTNLEGANRETLFTIEGHSISYQMQDGGVTETFSHTVPQQALFADDVSLYVPVAVAIENQTRHLEVLRVRLDTGEQTVVFKGESDNNSIGKLDSDALVGCTDNALLYDEVVFSADGDTGSLSGNIAALHHRIVALPVDGSVNTVAMRTLPTLYEYTRKNFATVWSSSESNLIYVVDAERTCLEEIDLATGQTRVVVQALPPSQSLYIENSCDGKLILYLREPDKNEPKGYIVDIQDGTLVQISLEYMHNGHTQSVIPYAEYQDDFLVVYEDRKSVITSTGTDGTPYVFDSYTPQYALISKQDYYAGNPNYREIEMLPQ